MGSFLLRLLLVAYVFLLFGQCQNVKAKMPNKNVKRYNVNRRALASVHFYNVMLKFLVFPISQ